LAEAARRLRPELKILFITGYAEGALMKQGFLPAGMQVLTKPFSLEALAAKVQSLLAV
jgi:CheY-like chemotaxis protein